MVEEMTDKDDAGLTRAAGDIAVEDGGQSAEAERLEDFQLAQQGSAGHANHAASSDHPNSAKGKQKASRRRGEHLTAFDSLYQAGYNHNFIVKVDGEDVEINQGKFNSYANKMATYYHKKAQHAEGQDQQQLLRQEAQFIELAALTNPDKGPMTPEKEQMFQNIASREAVKGYKYSTDHPDASPDQINNYLKTGLNKSKEEAQNAIIDETDLTEIDNSDLKALLSDSGKESGPDLSRTSFSKDIDRSGDKFNIRAKGDFTSAATQHPAPIAEIGISLNFNKVSAPSAPDIPGIKTPHFSV